MATVVVKKDGEDIDQVLRRLKKASSQVRKEQEKRKHFLSPREKRLFKRAQNRKFFR
ncbi:30S ribosomal protein S21 [Spiroplasma endosymbiont of Agriotes lineatus]|uniref:30S ribosomal protein S21 n=1 Tax=Spiroplasma endosymbiont of Agriotes lineatus TaxID=3077930 RepID=UPI0030CCFDD5